MSSAKTSFVIIETDHGINSKLERIDFVIVISIVLYKQIHIKTYDIQFKAIALEYEQSINNNL